MSDKEVRHMWLINLKRPWLRPYRKLVEISICQKVILGREPFRAHTYGVSMFGTPEAAERERRLRMVEMEKSFWHRVHNWNGVHQCRIQLGIGLKP